MSSLSNYQSYSAGHIENSHDSLLKLGRAFLFEIHQDAIAPAGVLNLRFLTGNLACIFEAAEFQINEEKVILQIYEDTLYSAPGALNSSYIRILNRIKNIPPLFEVYTGATITDDGTEIQHITITGAAGQSETKPGFGNAQGTKAFILKPNTEYLFRVTNNSVSAVDIDFHMYVLEESAREF